jgi:predicted RNA-binding protein with PIN domain
MVMISSLHLRERSGSPSRKLLLIDGYNLAWQLLEGVEVMTECGFSQRMEPLRNRIAFLADRLCHQYPRWRAVIVFDGPTFKRERHSGFTDIVYSGGNGLHRADHWILSQLRQLKSETNGSHDYVVTDDKGLARQVLLSGDKVLTTEQFLMLVGRPAA